MSDAATQQELAELRQQRDAALARESALAEVLSIINRSPSDPGPVFQAILEKAHALCGAEIGALATYDGTFMRAVAVRGLSAEHAALITEPYRPSPGGIQRLIDGARFNQIADIKASNVSGFGRMFADRTGLQTYLGVPLRKDGVFVGQISAYRTEVRPFTEKEIALLESFAAQAVIAMENARLLTELRVRDEDNSRLIARQSASIEILKTISASPDDPQPVFEMIARRARELCGAEAASVSEFDGTMMTMRVMIGHDAAATARYMASFPRPPIAESLHGSVILAGEVIHTGDIASIPAWSALTATNLGNAGSAVGVPLKTDGKVIGAIGLSHTDRNGFDRNAVALVESFAEQAVIAISSAKALRELRARTDELAQRQSELRITFENMGDGVAMFDAEPRLVAWNAKFQEIFAVPPGLLEQRQTYADYIRFLAQRGDYGADTDIEGQVRRIAGNAGQRGVYERTRPDGRVIEIRNNPVDGGGFVLIFGDITERRRNEYAIAAARDAAEEATRTIEAAYRDLKIAQANLVQAEKMASLGQLTAGIAHEIKNPLNFVNNFANLSVELLEEFKEAAAPGLEHLTDDQRADVDDLSNMLTSNLKKIEEHGKRADGIVRAMLEHSRGASGERRAIDLNALIDEAVNLAYHGARAQNQNFNITLERDFAPGLPPIEVNPQDMTRVFLNMFTNGFYAANKRAKDAAPPGFEPTLRVATIDRGDAVEVQVRDNGTGIPPAIRDKLFEPFFTTKPTGEGTGLGLSITYDIVTKQHGGTIAVESVVDDHTTFSVTLPRQMFGPAGGVA